MDAVGGDSGFGIQSRGERLLGLTGFEIVQVRHHGLCLVFICYNKALQAGRSGFTLRRRPKLVDAWPDGIFVKVMSGLPAPRPLFRIGCCGFSDPTPHSRLPYKPLVMDRPKVGT